MDDRERRIRTEASRAGRAAVDAGDPCGWFEPLYRAAREADAPTDVPWVDLNPNRFLLQWLERENPAPCRCVVVGCGLGDDAEEMARRGFDVTAFDVSPEAVAWCRERYPDSDVEYVAADVFAPPADWLAGFDLVVEVYTVQALPLSMRPETAAAVAELTAHGGRMVVVCHGRPDEITDPQGPPWPMSPGDCKGFLIDGMVEESFEEVDDSDDEGVVRFRAVYKRS